jgi:hypothetical protein
MLSTEDRRRAEGLDAALEKAPMLERPVLVYWPTLACLSWPPQPRYMSSEEPGQYVRSTGDTCLVTAGHLTP